MKILFILILLSSGTLLISKAQTIEPAPADKAVVYFVRTSTMDPLINFTYFDSTKFIGKFNGPKYIRYECEPGTHLFWARSENRDFVKAEVEAGKIYFIEAAVKMGAMKAAVELIPVDPKDEKQMAKIFKLMNKKPSESFTTDELAAGAKDTKDHMEKGLVKYNEEKGKAKGGSVRLEKTMAYSN
jgi:hypothetical protein